MRALFILVLSLLPLFYCTSTNECSLSESHSPTWSKFVLDAGHEKYTFRVDLEQTVHIYTGECAAAENVNFTTMKLTSFAPCEQTLNITVDVNLGPDSYAIKQDSLVIQPGETINFGTVKKGGPRIDFADITIAIYCPLCPEDTF